MVTSTLICLRRETAPGGASLELGFCLWYVGVEHSHVPKYHQLLPNIVMLQQCVLRVLPGHVDRQGEGWENCELKYDQFNGDDGCGCMSPSGIVECMRIPGLCVSL